MPDLTISNTSPLFYLYRLKHFDLLLRLNFHLSDTVRASILRLAGE